MAEKNISHSTLQFLKALKKNNDRSWFNDNKAKYQLALDDVKSFLDALLGKMIQHDNVESLKLFRIYRDVRFSKDKSPYKSSFSAGFKRATKRLRGGYYISIEPGNTFVGGGFWNPNGPDLKRIRKEIAADDKPFRKIINATAFKNTFGTLQGETVKTAPQGFTKDHPAIDLIRQKQFLVFRQFTDAEVTSPKFLNEANKTFKNMRPFFNYMSEVLTTDANGVSVL